MQETSRVAEDLLGCYLIRTIQDQTLIGRIVETEAYLGVQDSSCHSFKGRRTKRTQTMYLPGGYSYVYFTYGMHHCFNVVTGTRQQPEAVLIRAVEPIKGLSVMIKNRNKSQITKLCSGPAKLCQAFNLTTSLNALDLCQKGDLFISQGKHPGQKGDEGGKVPANQVEVDSRVGLSWHKDSSCWFLRFYIQNNPFVSLKTNQIG